jgi:hypothetical protein
VLLWPVVAGTVWVDLLVVGSLQESQALGTIELGSQREWLCVGMIALGGTISAMGMAPCFGLLGAKLLWVVEFLGEQPVTALLFSRGGLSWFGGGREP